MNSLAHTIVVVLWITWLTAWCTASFNIKRARIRNATLSNLIIIGMAIAAFLLMFVLDMHVGWMDRRFAPHSRVIEITGVLGTALGLTFTLWARLHLGRNWSASVRIGEEHELISSGPYARIRHPIYTGVLFAFLGTALVYGRWRSAAALILYAAQFAYKARREEVLLTREFGLAFEEHRRRTGFFLPRFPL